MPGFTLWAAGPEQRESFLHFPYISHQLGSTMTYSKCFSRTLKIEAWQYYSDKKNCDFTISIFCQVKTYLFNVTRA